MTSFNSFGLPSCFPLRFGATYPEQLTVYAEELASWGKKELSRDHGDITVEIHGNSFTCHSALLAAWSPHVRRLLQKEDDESRIILVGADLEADGFSRLRSWVYAGELNLTPSIVASVLPLAEYLEVSSAAELCKSYIAQLLQVDYPPMEPRDIVQIWNACKTHSGAAMKNCAFKQVVSRWEAVASSMEALRLLDPDDFLAVLSDPEFVVHDEAKVLQAVLRWLSLDRNNLDWIREVLDCVRLGLVSPSCLCHVLDLKLMSADRGVCEMLMDCLVREQDPGRLVKLRRDKPGMFQERSAGQEVKISRR